MATRWAKKYSDKYKEDIVANKVYDNAKERGEIAENILIEGLGFSKDEVVVLVDAPKKDIDEALTGLKKEAMAFEQSGKGKETMGVVIINVGYVIDPLYAQSRQLMSGVYGEEYPITPKKVGEYEDFFEMTSDGKPLNLNEAAAWIADTRTDKVSGDF